MFFTHQIRFEDVIWATDKALKRINPIVMDNGKSKKYSEIIGSESANIIFNVLIATGFHIIFELESEFYIKTSIDNAELDININTLLKEKQFPSDGINTLLSKLTENSESIAYHLEYLPMDLKME